MTACGHCDSEIESKSDVCSECGTPALCRTNNGDPNRYREQLLIERIADWTGVVALARRLPYEGIYPPYLLVGLSIMIAFVILPIVSITTVGSSSTLSDPITPVSIALGVIVGAVGVRYMADGYATAVNSLGLQDRPSQSNIDAFRGVVSFRTKLVLYVVGVLIYYLNLFLGPGVQTLIELDGVIPTVIGQFVLAPLVNLVLVVEFATMFFGIHFLLPRRVQNADLDLFFYDPRNMGGLSEIGQLLKRTYYVYTAGVLVYFIVAYGRIILSNLVDSPLPSPGLQVVLFFSIAWGLGFISILYSMKQMNRIMSEKRERRVRELETDIKDIIENPYDIRSSRVADQEAMETKERQLEQVRSTRTYPTTFTMWSQIAVSVLLPQVLQLVVQATL